LQSFVDRGQHQSHGRQTRDGAGGAGDKGGSPPCIRRNDGLTREIAGRVEILGEGHWDQAFAGGGFRFGEVHRAWNLSKYFATSRSDSALRSAMLLVSAGTFAGGVERPSTTCHPDSCRSK
jgi:hypothetical protein